MQKRFTHKPNRWIYGVRPEREPTEKEMVSWDNNFDRRVVTFAQLEVNGFTEGCYAYAFNRNRYSAEDKH